MLDTSVIVAVFTPEIIADFESYASSMICRAELARGLAVFAKDPARKSRALIRRELLQLLDSIPGFWMEFDQRAADGFGRLTAQPKSAMRLKDAPALSSPPKLSEPSNKPASNHLNPTGTS